MKYVKMNLIIYFFIGSARFRYIPGAACIEVKSEDALGESIWVPAKGSGVDRTTILEKALNRATQALSAHMLAQPKDSSVALVCLGHREYMTIELGTVG